MVRNQRSLGALLVAALSLLVATGCAQQPARRGGDPVAPAPAETGAKTAADPTGATDPTSEIRAAVPGAEVIIVGNTALVAVTGTTGATGTKDVTGTTVTPGATGTAGADARMAVSRAAPYLTEMRFTSDAAKASRLSTIAGNIRTGRSAVDFLAELADVSRGMTVVPLATRTDTPAATPGATPIPGAAPILPGVTAPGPATPNAPGTTGTAPALP